LSDVNSYVLCKKSGIENTVYPTEINVEIDLDIDGIPTASFLIDPSFYVPDLGETVSIYLEKEGTGKTVFVGQVVNISDQLHGKEYRWKEVSAQRWGKCLIERNTTVTGRTLATTIITSILQPLIDDGLLSSIDIDSSTETIRVDFSKGVKIRDALRQICSGESNESPLDWDFYVDNNKVFHGFARGSRTSTVNLYDKAIEYDYEKSIESLINKQKVIGNLSKVLGDDSSWSEDTVSWTVSDDLHKSTERKKGDYSVENYRVGGVGTSSLWMKRSVSAPIVENGIFKFYIYYQTAGKDTALDEDELVFKLKIRLKKDDSNYFEFIRDFGSAKQTYTVFFQTGESEISGKYVYFKTVPWKKITLGIGEKYIRHWTEVGSLEFSDIQEIYIEVLSPLPSTDLNGTAEQAIMRLDGVEIRTRVAGTAEDINSQNLYGLREGDGLINNKLSTDEDCEKVAQKIVNAWKDPIETIKNLTLTYNFDASIGVEYTFDDGSISTTQTIRKIVHSLKDFTLNTEIETSSKWIPSPERILKNYARDISGVSYEQSRDSPDAYYTSFVSVEDIGYTEEVLYPVKVSSEQLVFLQHLDRGEGTITYDSSKYLYDGTILPIDEGTIHGATFTTGKIGYCLDFNGSSDYVEITEESFSDEFTFTGWFNREDTVSYDFILGGSTVSTKIGFDHDYSWFIRIAGDFYGGGSVSIGEWHFFAISRDSSGNVKLYLDDSSPNTILTSNSGTVRFNKIGVDESSNYYKGKLDEIRIYNRCLSDTEVSDLYHQVDIGGGRRLCFRMEEGSGTIIQSDKWCEGKFGRAISFSGKNDYIKYPRISKIVQPSEVSYSAWVKLSEVSYDHHIVGWYWTDSSGLQVTSSGKVRMGIYDTSGTYRSYFSDSTIEWDIWQHILVTYSDPQDRVRIYINGELDKEYSCTFSLREAPSSYRVTIGKTSPSYPTQYARANGVIDEVRIYSRELSPEEVYNIYRYGGLEYYPPRDDITNIRDKKVYPPSYSVVAKEVDTNYDFRTWIEVTINPVSNAGGYIVGYKESTLDEYTNIFVGSEEGQNVIVATPSLSPSTSFDIRVASISEKGKVSAWSSVFSTITQSNDQPPPVPSGLVADGVLNGVWLYWDAVTASDFSHYKVYKGTSSPNIHYKSVSKNMCFWKMESSDTYDTYYFAVSAVDSAGNESSKSSTISAIPKRIKPIDLQIESRPWTSNLKIWWDEDTPTYNKLYWSAPDSISDATITFADGSTDKINANTVGTTFSDGLWYLYTVLSPAFDDLYSSQQYTDAVGEGKALLAIAQIDNANSKPPTILQFNSYTPTIGAGAIAAKAIRAEHLITDQAIITNSLQLDSGIITSDHVINLNADKVVFTSNNLNDLASFGTKTAILVKVYGRQQGASWSELASFITEQLGVDSFNSTTWTNYYYLYRYYNSGVDTTYYYFRFGGTYTSRIENFQVSPTTRYFYGNTQTVNDRTNYALSGSTGGSTRTILIDSISGDNYLTCEIGIRIFVLYVGNRTEEITSGSPICVASGNDSGYISASGTCPIGPKRIEPETGVTTITGDHIETGSIKTKHIRFDSLTSDPSYESGKLWWRSDEDQLRFSSGTQLSDVAVIPKYPLFSIEAPAENLIPNSDFEYDRDDNNVPDYWTCGVSGSGSYTRIISDSSRGGACLKLITDNSSSYSYATSDYIKVKPNTTYYWEVWVKCQYANNNDVLIQLKRLKRDKTTSSSGNQSLYYGNGSTSWAKKSGTFTTPSDCYYIKLTLHNYLPTTASCWILFDDCKISEIRAAAPTGRTKAAANQPGLLDTSVANDTWTNVGNSLTVPDEDHEIYFVQCFVRLLTSTTSDYRLYVRIYDSTDNEYYPSSTGVSAYYQSSYWYLLMSPLITIPKNVKNHVLKLQVKQNSGATKTVRGEISGWGHSLHYHR